MSDEIFKDTHNFDELRDIAGDLGKVQALKEQNEVLVKELGNIYKKYIEQGKELKKMKKSIHHCMVAIRDIQVHFTSQND